MIHINGVIADPEKPTLLMENIFTVGTVTLPAGVTADGSAANALGDQTFDYWTGTGATSTITVDMTSPVPVDMIGVAAHNLGTEGATIDVQSSPDNSTWTTRISISPLSDATIIGLFPQVSFRYWRVRVTSGPASVGVLKLGKRVIVPSGVSLGHVAANHAQQIELLSNDSIDGQFLGTRVIRRSGNMTLDFGFVDQEFIETEFVAFERGYNDGKAFFYAGGPSILPLDFGYCKRPPNSSEIRPAFEGGDLMNLSFEAQIYVG